VPTALEVEKTHLCKVFYSENGKGFTRRVTCMVVQRPDGKVVRLTGPSLPDTIAIYTGSQSESDGKGLLEVIEAPSESLATGSTPSAQPTVETKAVTSQQRFFNARDGFVFCVGMLTATIAFMWIFTAWVELRDFRLRTSPPATNQPYRPRF
jgi:hypothetical protein